MVSGQSLSSNGTKAIEGIGASYIAQGGGFCVPGNEGSRVFLDTTYGEFDMMPHPDFLDKIDSQIGSYG